MIKLPIKDFNVELDHSAEVWYGNITDEKIRSSLFDSDCWNDVDPNKYHCILTFEDLQSEFDMFSRMTADEKIDTFGEEYPPKNYTAYNMVRDFMMSSLFVVKSINRKEC